jgi:hypothetical protein
LHDQLGQQMTGVSIGLDRVQNLTELNEHPGGGGLARTRGRTTRSHHRNDQGRSLRYARAMRAELDDMGVQSAIQTYVREWVRVLSRRTKPESLKDLDCARAPKSSATSTRRGCSTNRAESLAARLPEGKHRCSLLP